MEHQYLFGTVYLTYLSFIVVLIVEMLSYTSCALWEILMQIYKKPSIVKNIINKLTQNLAIPSKNHLNYALKTNTMILTNTSTIVKKKI